MNSLRKRTILLFLSLVGSFLLSACISTGINGPADQARYDVYVGCGGMFLAMYVTSKQSGDTKRQDLALKGAGDLNYALKVQFPLQAQKGLNEMNEEKARVLKLSNNELSKYIEANLEYCVEVVLSTR